MLNVRIQHGLGRAMPAITRVRYCNFRNQFLMLFFLLENLRD